MESSRPTAAVRVQGRREMHNLALAAVSALEQSGLKDLTETLSARVFDRASEELCDAQREADVWRFSYKPMVELLLREIIDVLKDRELSREEQRGRIAWAIEAAGF